MIGILIGDACSINKKAGPAKRVNNDKLNQLITFLWTVFIALSHYIPSTTTIRGIYWSAIRDTSLTMYYNPL